MSKINNQSLLVTLLSIIGAIIGYFNLLWLFPKFLTQEEIGLVRTIQNTAQLLLPLACFGIPGALLKFYPYFQKKNISLQQQFSQYIGLSLIAFFLFITGFYVFPDMFDWIFKEKANTINNYWPLIWTIVLFLIYITMAELLFRILKKAWMVSLGREIFLRVLFIGLIPFYYYEAPILDFLIIGLTLIFGFTALLYYLILKLKHGIHFLPGFSFPLQTIKQKVLPYAGFNMGASMGASFVLNIDSIMVSSLLGFTANSIYTTAFFIGTVVEFPKRAVGKVIAPIFSKLLYKNHHLLLGKLFKQTALEQSIFGALIVGCILINLDSIYYLIPGWRNFSEGKSVVIIILFAKLIDLLFGLNTEIISLSKYYSANFFLLLFLIIFIILGNYFLIPEFGIFGAALSTIGGIFFYNLAKSILIQSKLKIHAFSLPMFKLCLVFLMSTTLVFWIPKINNPLIDIITRCLLFSIIYLIGIYYTKISLNINTDMFRKIKSLFTTLKF